jgi:hypothetical protein
MIIHNLSPRFMALVESGAKRQMLLCMKRDWSLKPGDLAKEQK